MSLTRTLLTHYRRHPVQALFLLIGIVVANVLLSGTLLINAQARASYEQGEQYLSNAPIARIRHRDASLGIGESDFIKLRRQGFDMLAPLLRQIVRTESGEPLELIGIDLFAMPHSARVTNSGGTQNFQAGQSSNSSFSGFAFPPYQLWAAPARLEQLGAVSGDRIQLASGEMLPPLAGIPGRQLGHRILVDIGALQSLTGSAGQISSMMVFPDSPARIEKLRLDLPDHLEFISNNDAPSPAELTKSFHLNLAAMGLLAFVVGVFLIYNAVTFSYTDRRELLRKLRLAGVLKSELARALILELTLFLVVGTLIGSWMGASMAAWLLPGVGQTLAQLYGVYITYPDGLVPSGIWLPFMMTVLAAGLCVLFPLREALKAPMLERRQTGWKQDRRLQQDRMMALAGLLLLTTALLTAGSAIHLWVALSGMACLLLGTALLLPMVLRSLIGGLQRHVPPQNARLCWLLSDSRWLLGPASLALMAMTLALVANSGLNTMINSFRVATDDWLNQRLVADLYLRADQQLTGLEEWLGAEMPQLEVSERYRRNINRVSPAGRAANIEVVSLRDGDRFRDSIKLMQGDNDARTKFEDGKGVYISERAWRIDGWQAGNFAQLCDEQPGLSILGVYRDYGNPNSQWMVSRQLFKRCWPEQTANGLSVSGPPDSDWSGIRLAITERFGLDDDKIIDQGELKQTGLAVFDRTFVVTRALNSLTLLVAAIGIFCAVSAIHHHRVGQQALLASLGMTRRERGLLLLLQWGVLGLLCMVLVWPFGIALAAYLAGVVTPTAFGWSFPLQLEWQHYLVLAAIAAGCLMLAVILPSLRLLHISPAALLREQNV